MGLSHAERQKLIEQYARGPARVQEALAKVPKEALQWRPAEKKWSVHEVVVHCADSETNASLRIRYLLAEKEPLIVGYDQEAWARLFDYHAQPLQDALVATEAARGRTVPLLRQMSEATSEATTGKELVLKSLADDLLEFFYNCFPEKRPHPADCDCDACHRCTDPKC